MSNPTHMNIAWADAEIAKRRQEILDLEAYKRVELIKAAERQPAPRPATAPFSDTANTPLPLATASNGKGHSPPYPFGGKKRLLLQIIADSANGATTQGVITKATEMGYQGMKIENVSPQLSTFNRKDEYISLVGGVWRITTKGRSYLGDMQLKEVAQDLAIKELGGGL